MLNEISGHLVQALVRGDDFVILAQQLVEQRLLVGVEFGFFDLLGDLGVQIGMRDRVLCPLIVVPQLLAAFFLVQPDR